MSGRPPPSPLVTPCDEMVTESGRVDHLELLGESSVAEYVPPGRVRQVDTQLLFELVIDTGLADVGAQRGHLLVERVGHVERVVARPHRAVRQPQLWD